MSSRKQQGFTLIELVVVIIIIAILAAVAVPKFYDRADDAREASTLQSLATLRSSIELFRVDTDAYPTASIDTELGSYLKSPFPSTSIGGVESATVTVVSSSPITAADADGKGGWLYNPLTGEIAINMASHANQ
ncbi:MAG: prepilin-type N-terminal cleavage/methylation domain-containing protein [Planctomycetota bacterium]